MSDKISIVIVDDHPLFRKGLRQEIENDPRFEVVGEAQDGAQALELIRRLEPRLAVLDVHLPQQSGLDVATALQAANLATQVVILTMLKDEAAFNRAMNVGVQGYVLKDSVISEIVNCLVSVAGGIPYVTPALSAYLLNRRERVRAAAERTPQLSDLTTAERRVLRRIAEKKSSKEIAAEFGVSPRTVDSHRANIGSKLGLQGPNSLLQFAIEHRDALADL